MNSKALSVEAQVRRCISCNAEMLGHPLKKRCDTCAKLRIDELRRERYYDKYACLVVKIGGKK